MRLALVSLIALGAVSTTAVAQEQTTAPAAMPAPAPAAAPAPAQTAPAAPATAPADQAAPPVAAPAAGAPAETYTAPVRGPRTTDPLSVRLMDVLDKVCKPSVAGGDFAQLVKDYGFKKKKEQWVLALEKPYNITLDNPGSNKNVCTITIDYAQTPEQAQELANALHDYATWENSPQLRLIRNDQTIGSDFRRFTVSWDDAWAGGHAGLVYMRLKKLDETSVGKNFERAQVLYSTTSR
ncbi:pyruvate/2-oxoglutarate dehydrogenase complex dihydrolipoamide acyltransferase (E2) component [Caulobacter sp. 1776]